MATPALRRAVLGRDPITGLIRMGGIAGTMEWLLAGYVLYLAFDIRRAFASVERRDFLGSVPYELFALVALWFVCGLAIPSLWFARLRGPRLFCWVQRGALVVLAVSGAYLAVIEVQDAVIDPRKTWDVATNYAVAFALASAGSITLLLRDRRTHHR
jgi:disulfide bond formation protein DsbB